MIKRNIVFNLINEVFIKSINKWKLEKHFEVHLWVYLQRLRWRFDSSLSRPNFEKIGLEVKI